MRISGAARSVFVWLDRPIQWVSNGWTIFFPRSYNLGVYSTRWIYCHLVPRYHDERKHFFDHNFFVLLSRWVKIRQDILWESLRIFQKNLWTGAGGLTGKILLENFWNFGFQPWNRIFQLFYFYLVIFIVIIYHFLNPFKPPEGQNFYPPVLSLGQIFWDSFSSSSK